ncbi:TIGR03826 family flagellar region protein [Bacillus suaedae]|uniref:Flagellar protein n=1 Tax=Halalkalibacter suaedae TaxID=2822140 RepID=A0A940WTR1_9BACI|nr:TIGR03826 family flagellar region protein [Bacillus suaedae]MBP3950043.1 hypothetical protein [Bacillus suaedae]
MQEVANCPKCGGIFVKALRPLCNNCYREQELQYETVSKFMRKKQNRMATIQEVHAKTEVPIDVLHQFIREGRILATSFPNLGYPCESCGNTIKEGRLCGGCKGNITSGLEAIQKENDFNELKKKEENKSRAYSSLNDRLNKK